MAVKKVIPLLIVILIIAFLKFDEVGINTTDEDKECIPAFMSEKIPHNLLMGDFDSEIRFISTVQHVILSIPSNKTGIPKGRTREFKDLLNWKQGLCYDLSRSIEKCLRYYGFHVRHVMIFQESNLKKYMYFFPYIRTTHQVTEVLTSKGWLIVDNIAPWLSLDENGNPVSVKDFIRKKHEVKWLNNAPHPLYESDDICVYGLYSMHGQFYPPYFPFPNVNYCELLQNLTSH